MLRSVASLLFTLASLPGLATAGCYDDAMIVFDGSGSMSYSGYGSTSGTRIASARWALGEALPRVPAERRLGLMTYGGQTAASCRGIQLRLAPRVGAGADILASVNTVRPGGDTPLAAAVDAAAQALDHTSRAATIVLVTDGMETCGGFVCDTARRLADEGRATTVHVVDFRRLRDLRPGGFEMNTAPGCLAHLTGGTYHQVEEAAELATALSVTLGCPLYGRIEVGTPRDLG